MGSQPTSLGWLISMPALVGSGKRKCRWDWSCLTVVLRGYDGLVRGNTGEYSQGSARWDGTTVNSALGCQTSRIPDVCS